MRLVVWLVMAIAAIALVARGGTSARAGVLFGPPAAKCAVVKLIGVRGSGDTTSALGVIASKISRAVDAARPTGSPLGTPPGLTLTEPVFSSYGLPYTAVGIEVNKPTLPIAYWLSERQGRNMLRAFIKEQVHDCPYERLAIIGYSQGAQVVGDVLSKHVGGLTERELYQVVAVALVADPRFNSQENFDHGSFRAGRNGILGARSPGDVSRIPDVQAWCRRDDIVCQGPGTPANHGQSRYLHDYKNEIVDFLETALRWRAGPATVHTFYDQWFGHTRSLQINPDGDGKEIIYDGCCQMSLEVTFTFSHPVGTATSATLETVIRSVKVGEPGGKLPKVGQHSKLMLKDNKLTDLSDDATFCDYLSGWAGGCGA